VNAEEAQLSSQLSIVSFSSLVELGELVDTPLGFLEHAAVLLHALVDGGGEAKCGVPHDVIEVGGEANDGGGSAGGDWSDFNFF
jgi:hypothetical protein